MCVPGPPPPVPAPARRRRRRTGPGRGPRFVCAGPARASAGPHRPREPPAPSDLPPGSERGERVGVRSRRGGPGGPPRCWARPRVPRHCLEPEPRAGAPGEGGGGGGSGRHQPGPAPRRPLRCPGSGRPLCPAPPPPPRVPAVPGPPRASRGAPSPEGRGASVRDRPAGLGLLRARGGGLAFPGGILPPHPPGLPCPACTPSAGHPVLRAPGPGRIQAPLQPAQQPAGSISPRHPDSPSAHPHLPAPPGCSGAGCPGTPSLPPRVPVPWHGVGDAAGTLGCSSLGRAGVLGSVGRWVRAALWQGCLPCTHHAARVHPPPSWGVSSTQLGRMLLSSRVPAFRTGLGAPRAVWAWAGPAPHQPQFSREPHGPAASPKALWASTVHVAGQEAAVSPGYILLPGIRCKGALPAKAAESSRNGSREGECRGQAPLTSRAEPQLGSKPPPSPPMGLSSPHHSQPLHPMVTRGARHSVPVGAASLLQAPAPRWGMRGDAGRAASGRVMGTVGRQWPNLAEPEAVRTLCWSLGLGWCRGMPCSCPAGIPVFSLGFPPAPAWSWRVRVSPPPARPRGGCWGPLLDRKGIWCCFLSTPTPWSSQPHWKHMCPG